MNKCMYEHCYQINAVRAVRNENFNNTLKSGLTRSTAKIRYILQNKERHITSQYIM